MSRKVFDSLRAASAMVSRVNLAAPKERSHAVEKRKVSEGAKKNDAERREFFKKLATHAASGDAMLEDFSDDAVKPQIDRQAVASAANYTAQIVGASQVFFSASVLSTILSEQGFKGLRSVKEKPAILVDGVSMMMIYNIFATEAALVVGEKIRANEVGGSALMAASSILASSATEAVIGNPLDLYSLKEVFLRAKIEHSLKANPALLDDLRASKALFEKVVPESLRGLSNAELARNFPNFNLAGKNIEALKKLKPEFNISAAEWGKMSAAGATFAALRNINFYLITYLINQSREAAKEGRAKELTPAEIAAIGTAGAIITSPLNMAAYSAAFRVNEGMEIGDAMKLGLKHAFADAVKNPRIFACLVAIRATATLICSAIFSDHTKEKISEAVNALAQVVDQVLQEEEKSRPRLSSAQELKAAQDRQEFLTRVRGKCSALEKTVSGEIPSTSSRATQVSRPVEKEGEKSQSGGRPS